jgi:hypothetical protein
MAVTFSDTIKDYAAAFVKVQAELRAATKDSANGAFKGTKYADLGSVWDACREPLAKHGMAVQQFPGHCADGRMHMTTIVLHESGQWMQAELSIPLSKVDAQGYGSAVTYARRYALAAVMGIIQEDDDGNAASNPQGASNAKPVPVITKDQAAELMALIEATSTDIVAFCKHYKTDAVAKLDANKFDHALKALKGKLPAEQAA